MADSVAPRIGYGARLYCDQGSGYVELGRLLNIKVPEPEIAKVKATHLNSANYKHEHIPGLIEHTSLGFEVEYGTSSFESMLALAHSRFIATWKVLAEDGGEYYVFNGLSVTGSPRRRNTFCDCALRSRLARLRGLQGLDI